MARGLRHEAISHMDPVTGNRQGRGRSWHPPKGACNVRRGAADNGGLPRMTPSGSGAHSHAARWPVNTRVEE